MTKITAAAGIILLIILAACSSKQPDDTYVTGTVTAKYGAYEFLEPSAGALFGNESIKVSPTHPVLVVDAGDAETYVIELDDAWGSNGPATENSLFVAVDVGTVLRFPVTLDHQRTSSCSVSRLCKVDPDDVLFVP